MRPGSMVIDYSCFHDMVMDFSDLVADKNYQKMSYNMWRTFIAPRPSGSDVDLDWDDRKLKIHFEGEQEAHMVCFGDDSFADYMWENYINNPDWYDPWYDDEDQHDRWREKTYSYYDYWDSSRADVKTVEVPDAKIAAAETVINNVKATALNVAPTLKHSAEATLAAVSKSASEISFSIDTKVDKAEFDARIQELTEIINKNTKNEKENKAMKGFNFDFGPVNGAIVRMSMYGLAVKNKTGTWVSYDAKNNEIMDVDILNFDGSQFIWKMPVAVKDVAVGDIVTHQNIPMFVVSIPEGGKTLIAVDPVNGERKEIMLTRSPFGFHFATKVVNLLGDAFGGSVNADNPFGNMWMLMALSGDSKNQVDFKSMMPMMLMANQGANMDPTMMMVMMAMGQEGMNGEMNLPMMMWMAQSMNKPAHACSCGGNCGQHQ